MRQETKNIRFFIHLWGAILPLALFSFFAQAVELEERDFTHFSLFLPPDWDGEEQSAFVSDNPEEYLLVLGKKDKQGESFLAQVSIFLLPNKNGVSADEAARTLAEAQGDASEPQREGAMWTFTGEPRTNVLKGRAKTLVNTDKEKMLIIIAQDPEDQGAGIILESLKGRSEKARDLLGR